MFAIPRFVVRQLRTSRTSRPRVRAVWVRQVTAWLAVEKGAMAASQRPIWPVPSVRESTRRVTKGVVIRESQAEGRVEMQRPPASTRAWRQVVIEPVVRERHVWTPVLEARTPRAVWHKEIADGIPGSRSEHS